MAERNFTRTPVKCAAAGCAATSPTPMVDGWGHLAAWEGIPDGYYCPKHKDAFEASLSEPEPHQPRN